ncbi:MAG: dipeptide epimerase, partial [Anaerolineales bacterium]|nr:dipeptide epimerase [Anaerolineales bacterium]
IRLEDDQGLGEGTIPPYYNISDHDMQALWEGKSHSKEPFPDDLEQIPSWIGDQGPAPARAALDLALHDRIGRKKGLPIYKLLNFPAPAPFSTAFTIAIEEPEVMARMAADHPELPIIKLKLGSNDDIIRVAAVRKARPDVRLYLDANAGWETDEAIGIIKDLEPFKIEMIEQPVAGYDIEGMGYVQSQTDIPIVADESIKSLETLEELARAGVQGINLKIMKLGGLGPTVRILKRGRELGLKIMLGCMTETSLGVTAMAHLAAMADWIDLDAPLLIANDPFKGVSYDQAIVSVPENPGIGIVRRIGTGQIAKSAGSMS